MAIEVDKIYDLAFLVHRNIAAASLLASTVKLLINVRGEREVDLKARRSVVLAIVACWQRLCVRELPCECAQGAVLFDAPEGKLPKVDVDDDVAVADAAVAVVGNQCVVR